MRALPLTLGALALALALGCDKTEEAVPTDGGPIVRDVGFADAAPDAATPPDAGAPDAGPAPVDVPAADAPATDAPATDAPATDVPANDGGSCAGDGGCYACAPSTTAQFLNRCTTASCAPFNNAVRLPLLRADGSLPPLP
jgi:hypothetical protein